MIRYGILAPAPPDTPGFAEVGADYRAKTPETPALPLAAGARLR